MSFIEILKSREVYPGYPPHDLRTEMGKIRYQSWVANGRPTGFAVELYDHPNYLKGLELGAAIDDRTRTHIFHDTEFASSFTGDYPRDAAGRPVHPHAEEIFAAGLAIEGPGAYWSYGPNLCADPIVLGVGTDRKLKTIVVERGDTGVVALPGGHCDSSENPVVTAFRELREETDVTLHTTDLQLVECVYQGVVPDPRTTINSWPETSAYAIVLHTNAIDFYHPVGRDDAASAEIRVVDQKFYQDISKMHSEFVHLAVKLFEQTTHSTVCESGIAHPNA